MKKIFAFIPLILFALPVFTSDLRHENNGAPEVDYRDAQNRPRESGLTYDASSDSEVMEITSFDGYVLIGKLTIPGGAENVSKLVIYVNGSGANTYDNKRPGFNYFDFFAKEFSNRGIAFFSYSTRGCRIGDKPPMYVDINYDEYQTYLPLNSVEDIYHMIKTIKENDRLKNCKVYLLGWSEGAIVAPLVAEKYPDLVDGLFLAGYPNQNMKDILAWQNTGGASMVWFREKFEADCAGRISRDAYEADPNKVVADVLGNASFDDIDCTEDGYVSEEDCGQWWKTGAGYSLDELLGAIENRDDDWLEKNYGGGLIPLTSAWFLQHFSLRSNMDVLPRLDLPMYIFHGTMDQRVDYREVYKINEKFIESGKRNLTIRIFKNHDHDLNYTDIVTRKEISPGIQAILDEISNM